MKFSLGELLRGERREPDASDHRAAVAQLLLELARLDRGVDPAEMAAIRAHLTAAYGLSGAQLDELVTRAREDVERSVSFHDSVRALNHALDAEAKSQLFLALWQVAHADDRVDPHEEALLRRLADLLHVPHGVFIRQKHRAAKTE